MAQRVGGVERIGSEPIDPALIPGRIGVLDQDQLGPPRSQTRTQKAAAVGPRRAKGNAEHVGIGFEVQFDGGKEGLGQGLGQGLLGRRRMTSRHGVPDIVSAGCGCRDEDRLGPHRDGRCGSSAIHQFAGSSRIGWPRGRSFQWLSWATWPRGWPPGSTKKDRSGPLVQRVRDLDGRATGGRSSRRCTLGSARDGDCLRRRAAGKRSSRATRFVVKRRRREPQPWTSSSATTHACRASTTWRSCARWTRSSARATSPSVSSAPRYASRRFAA